MRLLGSTAFDQLSARDICAESGVSYATFFRHFAGKEGLLDHVAAKQIAILVRLALPLHDSVGGSSGFRALCAYVEENRGTWSALLNGGAGSAMRAEWLRQSREAARTRNLPGGRLPKDLATIISVALISETISWWLSETKERSSADDVAAIIERMIETAM